MTEQKHDEINNAASLARTSSSEILFFSCSWILRRYKPFFFSHSSTILVDLECIRCALLTSLRHRSGVRGVVVNLFRSGWKNKKKYRVTKVYGSKPVCYLSVSRTSTCAISSPEDYSWITLLYLAIFTLRKQDWIPLKKELSVDLFHLQYWNFTGLSISR